MITSVAALAAKLSQVASDATTTAALAATLVNAEGMVLDYLRAALADPLLVFQAAATGTAIVRGYSADTILLPPHTIGSVSAVKVLSGISPITYTALTDAWEEQPDGSLYRPAGWACERYQITAAWGYGAAPASIQEVTLQLAVNLWRSAQQGSYSETVGADGGGSIRVIGALNSAQKAQLDAWVEQVRQVAL